MHQDGLARVSWRNLPDTRSRSPTKIVSRLLESADCDILRDTRNACLLKTIELLSHASNGDLPLILQFPEDWEVTVLQGDEMKTVSNEEILDALRSPIGAKGLAELAASRKTALLLVDDLTRPTPIERLLPSILLELESGGIRLESVGILVAGGTHPPGNDEAMLRKLGPVADRGMRIVYHDCRHDIVDLGRSARGTPIHISRSVTEYDLRIGIGSVYPHPAAGFSGGCKILVPGACGEETARALHRNFRAARTRGGSLECEFRRELEEISRNVGLDWVINVVLNQRRDIAAVFAGDPVAAHRRAVERAKELYTVDPLRDADVVVSDFYPFDSNLQFAHDRGMWPLFTVGRKASRVVLAACPGGVGTHELFPVSEGLLRKVYRRLKTVRLSDFMELATKLGRFRFMLRERGFQVLVLSPHLKPEEVRTVFPRGRYFMKWEHLIEALMRLHPRGNVRVAVYRCAPLLLPRGESA
jgi:nickel-dependent lactate racemase